MNSLGITTALQFQTGIAMLTFSICAVSRRQQVFDRIQRDMKERVGRAGVFIIRVGKPSDLIYPGVGGIGIGAFLIIGAVARIAAA